MFELVRLDELTHFLDAHQRQQLVDVMAQWLNDDSLQQEASLRWTSDTFVNQYVIERLSMGPSIDDVWQPWRSAHPLSCDVTTHTPVGLVANLVALGESAPCELGDITSLYETLLADLDAVDHPTGWTADTCALLEAGVQLHEADRRLGGGRRLLAAAERALDQYRLDESFDADICSGAILRAARDLGIRAELSKPVINAVADAAIAGSYPVFISVGDDALGALAARSELSTRELEDIRTQYQDAGRPNMSPYVRWRLDEFDLDDIDSAELRSHPFSVYAILQEVNGALSCERSQLLRDEVDGVSVTGVLLAIAATVQAHTPDDCQDPGFVSAVVQTSRDALDTSPAHSGVWSATIGLCSIEQASAADREAAGDASDTLLEQLPDDPATVMPAEEWFHGSRRP